MKTFLNNILENTDKFKKFNSITKYPSILTYHNLGPRGSLVDSLVENQKFDNRTVYITEKIDGTNSRIVFSTNSVGEIDDYIIGSREEFLFAKNDRIINQAWGIVQNMKPIADIITLLGNNWFRPNSIYCLYGETYGGKIHGAKQYTSCGAFFVRFFDLWTMKKDDIENIMQMNIDHISAWRESGKQPFVNVEYLKSFCDNFHLCCVPYIKTLSGTEIPEDLQGVWNWLQEFEKSNALIDKNGNGHSEGVVVRYADRSLIRKIRFEDYQKTKKLGLIQ